MKLEAVSIKRFRSIESGELNNCGGFNVFIGKNNSGKSNILSAMDTFFSCIHAGEIVSIDPPIGKSIDFFDNTNQLPIQIALTFSLQQFERDSLIQDIITEAPQVKNAVDNIDSSFKLSITISVINNTVPLAYVSKISLINITQHEIQDERTILSINNQAGLELGDQFRNLRKRSREVEMISRTARRVDSDDWRRATREAGVLEREQITIRTLLRRLVPVETSTVDILQRLESVMVEPTYEEFVKAVRTVTNSLKEEIIATQEKPLKNKVNTFAGQEASIPDYVRNLLKRLSEIKVLYLKEQRKQIGKEEAERLLSLKVQRGGPRVLRNIQETVTALLGVQVDAFQSSSSNLPQLNLAGSTFRSEATAELDVDNFLVEVNGSGIREALRLVLDYEFQRPDILLVEEPEIHLHPALETSMMRYLKQNSENCQVFVTTHSTNFIDTAEMKNVYLVSKSDSTQVQLLDLEEAEIQIPRELGVRLSSLFMFDRIIFVEGPSDVAIIREWASTLKVNLSQVNAGFITLEGARNFSHYAQGKTLSFLTKRRVKIWFLLDRDERQNSEINRLEQFLGEKATVKVLKKREVENYLLNPRAIVEFIKLKRKLSSLENGNSALLPTEADIRNSLDECAEKLKQSVIDKQVARLTCRSVHPSLEFSFDGTEETPIPQKVTDENKKMIKRLQEAIDKVEDVYQEQTKYVNNMWQSSKLDLVPGDHLLDMVCQKYGVRYKKESDGSRLAALVNENEIDREIKEIIQAIGREDQLISR